MSPSDARRLDQEIPSKRAKIDPTEIGFPDRAKIDPTEIGFPDLATRYHPHHNMGVTIHTVNDSASITMPCSSLQEFRVLLLQAYAQHIERILQTKYDGRTEFWENEDTNEYDEIDGILDDTEREARLQEAVLKDTLKRLQTDWIKKKTASNLQYRGDPRPNYEKMDECYKKRWDLFQMVPGLTGLYKFVVHNDCEGYHSVGDCFDILETLTIIQPEFKKLSISREIDRHYFTEFVKVFTDAVQNKMRVDYH